MALNGYNPIPAGFYLDLESYCAECRYFQPHLSTTDCYGVIHHTISCSFSTRCRRAVNEAIMRFNEKEKGETEIG